ncbi:MAG: ferritin-like domain-containing protein [Thermoleophilaceae bacterium]|nr:ferritin-like domain-containing protein [Thermoleophilaceae bacterium]
MNADRLTRRDALALAVATASPLLLGAGAASAQDEGDAVVLQGAIVLEQTAVVVYDTAVSSGLLDREAKRVAELFRDQEQEHADALIAAFERLGGSAPKPPEAAAIPGLSELKSQAGVTAYAIELETTAVAAYYQAHQQLQDPELLRTTAGIMANEGQHLVVLRESVGRAPVPNAFETGER